MIIQKIARKETVKRVAGYARVSTLAEEQEESYDTQVSYYTDKISATKGWTMVKVYSDKGITGTSAEKRPGFMEMIGDAEDGKIDIIFVGCDRVAANGDAANKIGTSGVAILAKHYGIPFYVCAPSSTIDRATPTGEQIPIEMRDPDEVTQMWYKERMAPQGIDVFNPAFDVTDHSLITGMITEKGLCTDPYEKDFDKYGI